VVANGEPVPDVMIAAAERSGTPLFTSPEQSPALMRLLSHIMAQALAPPRYCMACFWKSPESAC